MTARESAIKLMADGEDGVTEGYGPHAAEWTVCTLERNGIAVVDAELHRALVEAVRAVEWVRLVADHADEIDEWHGDPEAAPLTHARAVALLDEKEDG